MNSQTCFQLNTGQMMPLLGFGTARSHQDALRNAVRAALECGYRSIDTAYFYENEVAIGDELQDWFTKGKLTREEVFVTSKLPFIANHADRVERFLLKSLEKLKLSYLDLYLIHHPFGLQYVDDNNFAPKDDEGHLKFDWDTDLESLWRAMEKQVDAGRTKAIGISNFNSDQIDRIIKIARIPPAVNQIEVHGYFQQKQLIQKCRSVGIAVVAYSPLAAPHTEGGQKLSPILLENPTVLEIGKQHGKSCSQILLRFLYQEGIISIPKSATPERIKLNFEIFNFELSEQDMEAMRKLDKGKEGRIFQFKNEFLRVENHKEFPFHISF